MPIVLVLIWVLLGVVAGLLAAAARWGFAALGLSGWRGLLSGCGLGVVAALVGGVLGSLLFGRMYGTSAALFVALLAAALGPWLWARVRRQARGTAAEQ